MVLPKKIKLQLASTDVSAYVESIKTDKSMGDDIAVDVCTVTLKKTVTNAITPAIMQDFNLESGYVTSTDERTFKGDVVEIKQELGLYKIKAFSKMHDAVRRNVAKDYDSTVDATAGVISEIFKDLINEYTSLTADNTTVENSGTATILEQFLCKYTDVLERCQALSSALNWQVWFNHDENKVYFQPKKYEENVNTIYVGGANNNVAKIPVWVEETIGFMCNSVVMHGARDITTAQELFNGGGKQFTLEFTPDWAQVEISSTRKRGGKKNVSSSYDYSVDNVNRQINFVSNTPAGTNNVIIDYGYGEAVPVDYQDEDSIATYGYYERSLTLTDVGSVDDCYQRAAQYVNSRKTPSYSTKVDLKTVAAPLVQPKINQLIQVTDTINNVSGTFLIKRIVEKWPETTIEIHLGDREWREADFESDSQLRLKRLEENQIKNQDILSIIRTIRHDIFLKRYQNTFYKYWESDSLILGHSKNGRLGDNGVILEEWET